MNPQPFVTGQVASSWADIAKARTDGGVIYERDESGQRVPMTVLPAGAAPMEDPAKALEREQALQDAVRRLGDPAGAAALAAASAAPPWTVLSELGEPAASRAVDLARSTVEKAG